MLSSKEKRFIKYWEEQRKGGRWPYYLLYIPAGTFMCTIVVSFLILMTVIGAVEYLPHIATISLVGITIATIVAWNKNEKKFKGIIRREIKEGIQRDQPEQ